MTQEIRLTYFFLPVVLQVQANPGGEDVTVLQSTWFGTFEFIRLPVAEAHKFADLLELAADNADANPVTSEAIGEIHGTSVRALGTAQVRIQLSVKRRSSIRFGIRHITGSIGRKTHHSTPTLSAAEARRFATALREANMA